MQDGAIPTRLEPPAAAAAAAAAAGGDAPSSSSATSLPSAAPAAAPTPAGTAAAAAATEPLGPTSGASAPLPSSLASSSDANASGGAQAMDLDPPAAAPTLPAASGTPAASAVSSSAVSSTNGTSVPATAAAAEDASRAGKQEPPATKAEPGQDEDSQRRSELAECRKLLEYLTSRADAAPFLQPVDWKTLGLPDYPTIIKHPMDLGSIGTKLGASKYDNAWDFANDVRLVWKNAMTYNQVRSPIYNIAEKLMRLFERKFDRIVKAPKQEPDSDVSDVKAATVQDRIRFATLAKALNSEQLAVVIEMIETRCPNALNEGDDELEIEVYHIDAKSLREINDYAESCVGDPVGPKKSK